MYLTLDNSPVILTRYIWTRITTEAWINQFHHALSDIYKAKKVKTHDNAQHTANDSSSIPHFFHLNLIASHRVLLNLLNSYQRVENIDIL